VDYAVNRNYFITRQLSVVIDVKKFVVDNIVPRSFLSANLERSMVHKMYVSLETHERPNLKNCALYHMFFGKIA
jgi:hypothetical protein